MSLVTPLFYFIPLSAGFACWVVWGWFLYYCFPSNPSNISNPIRIQTARRNCPFSFAADASRFLRLPPGCWRWWPLAISQSNWQLSRTRRREASAVAVAFMSSPQFHESRECVLATLAESRSLASLLFLQPLQASKLSALTLVALI